MQMTMTPSRGSDCLSTLMWIRLEMEVKGEWIAVIADTKIATTTATASKPSWLTPSVLKATEFTAKFVISTNDVSVFNDKDQSNLQKNVTHNFRVVSYDEYSGKNATKTFSVTFKHRCWDNELERGAAVPAAQINY